MELFKLFGTIAVNNDGAIQAIDETSDAAEQSEGKMSNAFDKIGSAAVKVGKVVVAGLAAGATAIGALTKSAVAAYGDYEQLVGGVETLFKDSANKVMEYANNAYKTAGLSANEYMETVTSFSASLLQGLGGDTAEAAEIAHIAITDMADNANKMGTSISSIQDAYQGFAKQNYTMLDNLKLGYGGTQTEMIRLINDSGILEETISDLDNVTFDQMIQAIHVVQENMGITGTTALEASTTIQGSVSSMKSAWSNMLVGLADDTQNFDVLLGNFVDSAVTVVGNILPRIQIIFNSIPQLINGLVPQIAPMLQAILPGLIEGAIALVDGLVGALPDILDALTAIIPILLEGLATILTSLMNALPDIITSIVSFLTDAGNIQMIIEAAITLLTAIITAIPDITLQLVEAAPQIIEGIITGLLNAVPKLLSSLGEILQSFLDAFLGFFGIHSPSTVMEEQGEYITDGLINGLKGIPEKAVEIFQKMKEKISEKFKQAKETVTNVATGIKDKVSNIFGTVKSNVTSVWDGIKTAIETPINKAKNIVKSGLDAIKGFFDKLKIKFPDIKLPHFKITGKFSLNPISVPKLSIDWYAKAMDNAMLLNSPTIFGMNGAGQLMGGGEAGQEVVAGSNTLMNMIRGAVQAETSGVADRLERLISMLAEYLPEITLNANRQLVLDTGVLVGQIAPTMDSQLGNINRLRERGQ